MINHVDANIANGTSATGILDIAERVIGAFLVPAGFDGTTVTILASVDGTNFFPVYDAAGTELAVTVAVNRYVVLSPDATRPFRYAQLRAGTAATPQNQSAARSIRVVLLNDTAS